MLILTHVLIALTSIAISGLTVFLPSRTKLRISWGMVAATLVSGTVLVVSTHSPLLSACVTGLVYLTLTSAGLILAHRRLVASTN